MASAGSGGGGAAKDLIITRTAAEPISALKAVRAISVADEVKLADKGVDFKTAQVLGIALNAAAIGEKVRILVIGVLKDAFFSSFTEQDPLYLGSSGVITDVPPGPTEFRSQIAKALGGNEIFVQIEQPIELA